MARVYDRNPRATDDHNPLKNLLDFNDTTPYVEQAGDSIRNSFVNVIKEITGIDLTSWDTFLETLKDGIGVDLSWLWNAFQDLVDRFVNIVNGTIGAVGHVIDDFHDAWQNVLDFIGQGADGTSNSNNAITNTKGSISSLRQTVVATSAAVQALTSGAGAFDDFNRVDVTLGSDWDQELTFVGGGSGGWATDGTVSLYRPIYPYGTMEIRNRWKGATLPQSTSDYQYVAMVLGSAPGTDAGYTGWNDLLCCINNTGAMTDYVRCRIRSNGDVHFSTFVGGVETQFYGIGGGYLAAGARAEFWCGDLATSNPHKYKLRINGAQTFTRTDLGATRSVGSGFRKWGYGGRVEGPTFAFSAPPAVPGTVNQWSGLDQL